MSINSQYIAPVFENMGKSAKKDKADKGGTINQPGYVYDPDKAERKRNTYIPFIQRIMNATIHAARGCVPASIIYGRALELDQNLLPMKEYGFL